MTLIICGIYKGGEETTTFSLLLSVYYFNADQKKVHVVLTSVRQF